MDIEEALDLATRFILLRLHGRIDKIEPVSATFDDEDGVWLIVCGFMKQGTVNWLTAKIWIDDAEEEVTSFEVVNPK